MSPSLAVAQSNNSSLSSALSATIRAAIMQDPRSATLSATQIDSMVAALSAKAQTQGLTVQDIAYQPGTRGITVPNTGVGAPTVDTCAGSSWCEIGAYLGSGVVRNPFYAAFWVLSLMLMVIILHMRKNPHQVIPQNTKAGA
ncbi:MAG TPA: hypothetical protein VMU13_01905 [Candidatus Paceibacterota bacterium]|nr:hypothetical protein [Candidatus Paceibacterota bacterium]